MTQVVPGQWLRTDAATSLLALMQAYQARFGSSLHINSSYRPLGSPSDAVNPAGSQWAVYNYYGSPRAATPGHSNHGWGVAVDFGGPIYTKTNPNWDWLIANAGQYGWWWAGQFLNVSTSASPDGHEDWHWEYDGTYTGSAPNPGSNLAALLGADVAIAMNRTSDNVIAVYDAGHWQEFFYGPGAPQYAVDFAIAIVHSLPVMPYDSVAWDYRSNRVPSLKLPLYTINTTAQTITLIP